jgi:predicted PurR-regulated permease PerM
MTYLDRRDERATLLIALLGLGLAVALWPFASGLIGAPVLMVAFHPVHRLLARRMPVGAAAGLTVLIAALVIVVPGAVLVTLLLTQAQELAAGVMQGDLLDRLATLKFAGFDVGAQLKEAGAKAASLLGSLLVNLAGGATRALLQLTIAFFGLYYLLSDPARAWDAAKPFIPFSDANQEKLRERFVAITASTLIGTLLTAAVQGTLLGAAFAIVGLPNAVFWGAVTVVVAILPVVGSGMIWIPACAFLLVQQRPGAAIFLAAWSVLLVGNIDNVIRPWVFQRFASVHPFVTIIGAFAGIRFFGLLGLAMGPLAISYFFELIRMHREENPVRSAVPPSVPPSPPPSLAGEPGTA